MKTFKEHMDGSLVCEKCQLTQKEGCKCWAVVLIDRVHVGFVELYEYLKEKYDIRQDSTDEYPYAILLDTKK